MIKNKKCAAFIQCTCSEIYDSLKEKDHSIFTVKKSGLFDEIYLVAPALEESKQLKELAEKWEIKVYLGDVFNVAKRFYDLGVKLDVDIIVRVQLKAFYVDINLIKMMIQKLIRSNCDYIELDKDVNYTLAGDVFSFKALIKAYKIIEKLENTPEKKIFEFSPWALLNDHNKFKVEQVEYKKLWPKQKVQKIKKKYQKLLKQEENKIMVDYGNPGSRYSYYLNYINEFDIVLDVACGQGAGTRTLANKAKYIYGIDYNNDYINNAKIRFQEENISFICGTNQALEDIDVKFDKIFSSHTLEHVDDEIGFLNSLYKALSEKGLLILEVPRFLKYPLGEPLLPIHKIEYTYNQILKMLIDTGFKINEQKGVDRNQYVSINDAREAFLFICSK